MRTLIHGIFKVHGTKCSREQRKNVVENRGRKSIVEYCRQAYIRYKRLHCEKLRFLQHAIHSTTIFHSVYFPPQWRSQCLRAFWHHTYTDKLRGSFPSFQATLIFVIIFLSFFHNFFFLYSRAILSFLYYLFSFFSSLFLLCSFFIFPLLIPPFLFSFFSCWGSFVTPLLDVLKLFQHFEILLHASFKVLSQSHVTLLLNRTTLSGRQLSTCAHVCVGTNLMTRVR